MKDDDIHKKKITQKVNYTTSSRANPRGWCTCTAKKVFTLACNSNTFVVKPGIT